MAKILQKLLDVPTSNPDDARRGRLLNILLFGVFVSALVGLILIPIGMIFDFWVVDIPLLVSIAVFTFAPWGLYFVNRRSGRVAAFLFLLLLTVGVSGSDSIDQLVDGRSLLFYSIPIAIASLVLHPLASFIFAILSTIILFWLGSQISVVPNLAAIIGFFMLALVSWLSSRSLEQALHGLREINRELDRRVEERTRELSESLTRELVEAGKTQAILDGIADGVLVFDDDHKVLVANPALGMLIGIPPGELIGLDMEAVAQNKAIAREDRGHLLALLHNPAKDSAAVRVHWGDKTLSVNASPVSSGLGDILGTVAVFRDFTREAEIERMKNSFVAMVSHELRTPLNAVLAYSEMLRDAVFGSLNEKQFSATNRIFVNSQRLLNIVSDLLDQAQIEAGRLKIQLSEFRAADLLENIRSVMEKPAQDKGLQLNLEIASDVPEIIVGDAHRIQQVMVNLVNNAVKFTREGSVAVQISFVNPETWAIAVTDTGPGIPLGDQAYVFDAFRQVESITTREHGGIGLGLSIVKRLAILMGGDITLESVVGKGSTFTVTLPLSPLQREEIK